MLAGRLVVRHDGPGGACAKLGEMDLRVPDVVASAAVACGAGGWLRDLPGLIAGLEAEWRVA
jgi:hypothetical protein